MHVMSQSNGQTQRTSLNISKSAHVTASEHKNEGETWDDYATRVADHDRRTGHIDADFLRAIVREEVERALGDVQASVDTDELAEALSKKMGSDLELSAFRGASDALEEASR